MTTEGTPDRACVIAGESADDECECGQLTVALDSNYEANATAVPRAGDARQLAQVQNHRRVTIWKRQRVLLLKTLGLSELGLSAA